MATQTKDAPALADTLLQRIGQTIGERVTVSTVFGEPVERDGVTVIPVAKARFGFGGGGGGGVKDGSEGSGGGGGGGALVSPVGYIELRAGSAQYRRISTPVDLLVLAVSGSIAALAFKRLLA